MRENSRCTREDPLLHRIDGNREFRDTLKGWKEAVTLKSFQANTSYRQREEEEGEAEGWIFWIFGWGTRWLVFVHARATTIETVPRDRRHQTSTNQRPMVSAISSMVVRKIHHEGGIVFSPGIFLSRAVCRDLSPALLVPSRCLDGQSVGRERGKCNERTRLYTEEVFARTRFNFEGKAGQES